MPKDAKTVSDKQIEDEKLDEELEETFPASDPPAATAPGGGTGAEVNPGKRQPAG